MLHQQMRRDEAGEERGRRDGKQKRGPPCEKMWKTAGETERRAEGWCRAAQDKGEGGVGRMTAVGGWKRNAVFSFFC